VSRTAREASLYHRRGHTPRRWLGPVVASLLVYAGVGRVLLSLPRQLVPVAERPVDVRFVEPLDFVQQVPKPEPPAAPAPAPALATPKPPTPAARPAAAAPVVRPDQTVRRLTKPPPPKELRAPRTVPTDVPKEADPSQDRGVAVEGTPGPGDPTGLEGGVARGGVAGGVAGGAIRLPADAQPPRLLAGATMPRYPPEARADRRTGTVILQVVIYADGTVGDVHVVDGEEPFVTAAVHAVKEWRYEPARHQGQPVAVYRQIRIPFELAG
jgi:periplasmic protein TonB